MGGAHRHGGRRYRAAQVLGVVLALGGIDAGVFAQSDTVRPAPTHRALRDNADADTTATQPEAFNGYPAAPAFTVVPQRDGLTFYPCSACHDAMQPNPTRRRLDSPHPAALHHGGGRLWCLDCHQEKHRDWLHTLAGESVDINDAYLVCGQCHANRQRDWYFGAHGKRVANWQGQREIYNCTHCHDPHDPHLKPRAPGPPPPVRAGLVPMPARAPDAR